jgi:hypothetical protein
LEGAARRGAVGRPKVTAGAATLGLRNRTTVKGGANVAKKRIRITISGQDTVRNALSRGDAAMGLFRNQYRHKAV